MQVFGSFAYDCISIVLNTHIDKYRDKIPNTEKNEQLSDLPQRVKRTLYDI